MTCSNDVVDEMSVNEKHINLVFDTENAMPGFALIHVPFETHLSETDIINTRNELLLANEHEAHAENDSASDTNNHDDFIRSQSIFSDDQISSPICDQQNQPPSARPKIKPGRRETNKSSHTSSEATSRNSRGQSQITSFINGPNQSTRRNQHQDTPVKTSNRSGLEKSPVTPTEKLHDGASNNKTAELATEAGAQVAIKKTHNFSGRPADWNVDAVCEFITSIPDCSPYAAKFRSEHIDGAALIELDKKDLKEYFDMPLGLAVKICSQLKKLEGKK
ncbi:unnamed protein product [Mytilus edulis]|uniref:SAM domain-containing protein n=1 Tax=Mytilus edulis TaxID=6550 RepID=A0A8S3TVS3_MYTED|nr:unnamed protein product [Mytilus edulis]